MRPTVFLLTAFLLNAFPVVAEAALPSQELKVGDRVLAAGGRHRKCSARVAAVPGPGFVRLAFDRAACGDDSVPYDQSRLQRISFVSRYGALHEGDSVVVKGHFGADCGGRVHELSRSGYVSVDLDSLLCADAAGLFRARDVTKVALVSEAGENEQRFTVGEKVSARGIHEGDVCRGEIRKLTDTGLAEIAFEELTCAYAGKLYSLGELKAIKAPSTRRHASGELIFQRVMREIASRKKGKRLSVR